MASENNDINFDRLFTELNDHDDRIKKMEERISVLDKNVAISEIILNRVESAFNKNIDVLSKTTDAINCIEKTMLSMQNQINTSAEITVRIKNQVDQIENRFRDSEEKAKLDFRDVIKELVKSKLLWVLGGGFLISILQVVLEIIKNFNQVP